MKKLFLRVLFVLLPSIANAHDGNDGWVTINDFKLWSNTYNNPQIRIEVSGGYYNPAGPICADVDSYMVSTSLSLDIQKRIYSTLLSAAMANKSVRIRLDTNSCESSRPKIITVVIQ